MNAIQMKDFIEKWKPTGKELAEQSGKRTVMLHAGDEKSVPLFIPLDEWKPDRTRNAVYLLHVFF